MTLNKTEEEKMRESLPCPFCGSANISEGEVLSSHPNGKVTQSMCVECGALGPEGVLLKNEVDYGNVKATEAWNRRTANSQHSKIIEDYDRIARVAEAGQTNYCPMCEDQARRIEELERRQAQLRAELFSLASTVSEYLLFTAKSTDLSKAYHSAIEVINATPSHSAAWEWNQHVEWMKNLPVVAWKQAHYHGSDSFYSAQYVKETNMDVTANYLDGKQLIQLVAIPELKEVE